MAEKAYFMVKMKTVGNGDGRAAAMRDLKAMPEVEIIEPVSGEYDFVVIATVDTPVRVGLVAKRIESKAWLKNLHILKVESAEPNPFLDEVCSLPGGEGIRRCMQCGMCSASCPDVEQMDYSPRKMVALIRAGKRYDVLTGNTMWICASCYLCTVRCPKDVKITELMHSLERLAARHGLLNRVVSTPAVYKAFVDSIKRNGRVHEVGMMIRFYLSTLLTKSYLWSVLTRKANPLDLIGMFPIALQLLLHRRMSITPRKIRGSVQIKAILDKARALEGGE
ncbi:4Fe-4S dicluster domain-containing protein [Chloroflexota bacterium]